MKKAFLLAAFVTLACGAINFPTTPPTAQPDLIETYVVGTANAALTQTAYVTSTPVPTQTLAPTWTALPPAATPFLYQVSTDTATPALTGYEKYAIEALRARTYGGGELTLVKQARKQKNFTTYLVKYPSDGLWIYALASIPNDAQTRAVVIVIHGYADTKQYDLYDDGPFIDNKFAQEGFIVLHPAMRNYPPSDQGDNLFRVGHAIDVLNLLAIVKAQSGQPGLLQYADGDRVGIAGSSMGGSAVLRALTVNPDVKAAVLLASVSGDEKRNVALFHRIAGKDPQFKGETLAPDGALEKMSPAAYYDLIAAPVMLAHGVKDALVPVEWAQETCYLLQVAEVDVACYFNKKVGHAYSGPDREEFLEQAADFFDKHLR